MFCLSLLKFSSSHPSFKQSLSLSQLLIYIFLLFQAEKTARMKSEMRERTLKNFLLSQKHVVFTDPVEVQAGSAVTVFYNPANAPLNGKPEVWFRCSFNRWSHRKGPLPPQKMLPADSGSHVKATGETPFL